MRKLQGLLRLVRFELPFAVGVCVVMGQVFALGAPASIPATAFAFLSIFFVSASILVLNDCLDVETDRINAPHRPIPSGLVTESEALSFSLLLMGAGLLLGFRLRPFTKRAQRKLVERPQFYYMDAGVFRSLRPKGPLDSPEEIGGACLEGLVAQHLRAWIAYGKGEETLYFWRTRAGLEVDFIVYGEDTFLAIEVKRSRVVSGKDVRPLRAFQEDYPQAKVCLLYGGKEPIKINDVLCLPCKESAGILWVRAAYRDLSREQVKKSGITRIFEAVNNYR